MVESLQRAADVFSEPLIQDAEEGHIVYIRISEWLSARLRENTRSYLRYYWRQHGWRMLKMTATGGYIRFQLKPKPPKKHRAE